jgi:hypothetical protein
VRNIVAKLNMLTREQAAESALHHLLFMGATMSR